MIVNKEKTYELISNIFTVMDIATPLVNIQTPDAAVEMSYHLLDFETEWVGIVKEGNKVYGYVEYDPDKDSTEYTYKQIAEPITTDMIISNSTTLFELVPLFRKRPYYFIITGNELTHVVSYDYLEQIPFRTWLFSMIMELESNLNKILALNKNEHYEKYIDSLPTKRLKALENNIKRKGIEDTDLKLRFSEAVLYTNIVDKKDMLKSSFEDIHSQLDFRDSSELDLFFDKLYELRNSIAHGSPILGVFKYNTLEFHEFIINLDKVITEINNINRTYEI